MDDDVEDIETHYERQKEFKCQKYKNYLKIHTT